MMPFATRHRALTAALGLAAALVPTTGRASEPASPFARLEWRNVGPVNMGGRVTDVEGVPGNPKVVWVGAASGGVWKTEDGGVTFKPVFDDQPIASIGDIALAPSNPDVVYVGTGEGNPRNSVSVGDGVYKSTDGGRTWSHTGLDDTRNVTKVLVDPRDPDVVWVAALCHVFGPNAERGVFRSGDGGTTWERVLYLDDGHGAADLDMDPANPNVLYATLWRFERKPWTFVSGDERGGVWRSVDGGKTWKKLGKGLPKLMGRIGVQVAPSDPRIVYVIAESDEGTLFRSEDGGDSFRKVSDDKRIVSRGLYYTHLRVDPTDADRVYAVSSLLMRSLDGGKTFERISNSTHIDFHALWIDPKDPGRLWQGQDGGVAVTYDRGRSWEPIRNLPIAQFYQVYADRREPFYDLGGGLQDNGTWYGPSRTREPAGILPDDWRMMSFGDAYFVVPHPDDPDILLSESQGGNIVRTDMHTRRLVDVSPQPRRNDGGPVSDLEYRFNWNAPIVASPHDPLTVYFGGNVVFRTRDFGDTWDVISPDLTTDDPDKQKDAGGPVWFENTTAEYHCTIISLAESPAQAGVLWAGTDDGNLQVSRDDGRTWTNVAGNVPGLPKLSPVSHVEPSLTEPGTAYVAFDRHMFDDLSGYVYKTADFGKTWTDISGDFPAGAYVFVVRQDPRNHRLLYAGTELGLYASYAEGRTWQRLHLKNLPTVAVHDVLIHPRDDDLILATHGRALWIFDDATPIQQYEAGGGLRLFDVRPALRFPVRFTRYGLGDKVYRGPNPPYGALITYFLPESLEPAEKTKGEPERKGGAKDERIKVEILDGSGRTVRTLTDVGREAGLNRVAWDLNYDPPRPRKDEEAPESDFSRPPAGPPALPGTYTVRLTVDGQSRESPVEVRVDPLLKVTAADLGEQHRMLARLSDLRSSVNDALRGLDVLREQMKARRSALEHMKQDLPEEVEPAWKDAKEGLDAAMGALARPEGRPFWSLGPRLGDRLDDLAQNVADAFGAPTAAQQTYLRELGAESSEALSQVDALVAGPISRLNQALGAHGIPPLAVPARGAAGPS
jgi:photosystem II stability/assembly factor-like uncharacterized protein